MLATTGPPPGSLGNLNPSQEAKLREFWNIFATVVGHQWHQIRWRSKVSHCVYGHSEDPSQVLLIEPLATAND